MEFKKITPYSVILICILFGSLLLLTFNNCGNIKVSPVQRGDQGSGGSLVDDHLEADQDGFSIGSGFNGFVPIVKSIVLESNNKILIGGMFDEYNGQPKSAILRLNSDGSLDLAFEVGTGFSHPSEFPVVSSIARQSDGKILVGGSFGSYKGQNHNNLIRLNSDGSIDNTFNSGTLSDLHVETITLHGNKILIGGNIQGRIKRLLANGSLDPTFIASFGHVVNSIFVLPSNKLLLSGGIFGGTLGVTQLLENGATDTTVSFGSGIAGLDPVSSGLAFQAQAQSDGKILLSGDFSFYNGQAVGSIVRLLPNGQLDSTFNTGTGFDNFVTKLLILPDGKIVAIGYFQSYNGQSVNRIARLLPNGQLDSTFNVGSGFNNSVHSIALQSDGKLLVGGVFTSYQGVSYRSLIRLNPDGTIDLPESEQ